MELYLGS